MKMQTAVTMAQKMQSVEVIHKVARSHEAYFYALICVYTWFEELRWPLM